MRTPLEALHDLPLAHFIRTSSFAYPALEIVHIVGIALLFGTLWLVDLRVLGMGKTLEIKPLTRYVLPWTLLGFTLIVMSGSLMLVSRIQDFISNPVFIWKFSLIALAATNAAILHTRAGLDAPSRLSQFQAALSVCLWLSVITAGRWIAYV
jgi:hypothetical protein